MFNIFLSIQRHRKSRLHPKLCPQPGGSLGYHHHSMPVPVATSRSNRAGRASRRRSLPCPVPGGHRGAWRGSGASLPLTHTCGCAGDDCSPWGISPANATHVDAVKAVALGKTGNWFPWFSPHLFPVFQLAPCLGKKAFLKCRFFFCLFWFYSLERIIITVWQKYQIHNSENSSG